MRRREAMPPLFRHAHLIRLFRNWHIGEFAFIRLIMSAVCLIIRHREEHIVHYFAAVRSHQPFPACLSPLSAYSVRYASIGMRRRCYGTARLGRFWRRLRKISR